MVARFLKAIEKSRMGMPVSTYLKHDPSRSSKMRNSQHSKDICAYAITQQGVVLTARRLNEYRALITGIPARWRQGEP
jgi:hypothetical protein